MWNHQLNLKQIQKHDYLFSLESVVMILLEQLFSSSSSSEQPLVPSAEDLECLDWELFHQLCTHPSISELFEAWSQSMRTKGSRPEEFFYWRFQQKE